MSIAARFAVVLTPTREQVVWSTTYTGRRAALLAAGLATSAQFPRVAKACSSCNGAHPQSGRWYLWQEHPLDDVWSITYYADGLFADFDHDELRLLQRHLLNELQITPETIGAIVRRWRQPLIDRNERPAAGHAGAV